VNLTICPVSVEVTFTWPDGRVKKCSVLVLFVRFAKTNKRTSSYISPLLDRSFLFRSNTVIFDARTLQAVSYYLTDIHNHEAEDTAFKIASCLEREDPGKIES
jgi:hypothetical protein